MQLLAAAALALLTNVGHAASVWQGQFHTPMPTEKDKTVEWVFTTACDDKDECTISSAFMRGREKVPPADGPEIIVQGAFKPNPMMTKALRFSVRDAAAMAKPPMGSAIYDAAIYPQIGSPDRVLECRSEYQLGISICLLDRPLIDTGGRQRSEWVLLLPDYSSGAGCPGAGSVCPATLWKK
ncbi:MAG TPA: hypothetical protein VFS95_04815 [Telluria sp.]|nr:hypothetical protein [Telluria sp.]